MGMQGTVTGVMTVEPWQVRPAAAAAADFLGQTVPVGPLIVAVREPAAAALLRLPDHPAVEVVPVPEAATPGELLDRALDAAGSTYLALWSAEARHHPARLARQLRAFEAPDTIGTALADQLWYLGAARALYWLGAGTGCGGILPETLLCLRRPARAGALQRPLSAYFHALGRYGRIAPLSGAGYLHVHQQPWGRVPAAALRGGPPPLPAGRQAAVLEVELGAFETAPFLDRPVELRDRQGTVLWSGTLA